MAPLSRRELLDLPASVPLWPTVGQALGLGRSKVYELAARDELPVRVLRLGQRGYRVASADLLAALGLAADDSNLRERARQDAST